MTENIISIKNLKKSFGEHEVLKGVDLDVKKGEVVSVIGASGSGKSTMLRCINLLETPSDGEILYNGRNIQSADFDVAEYRAKVGMVFQQFNLFNNMDVMKNCVIGQMKVLKRGREEAEKIALEYLGKVGMSAFIKARPAQLSGGQKQRVAIARAILNNPRILIFDEATSALDYESESIIQNNLKEICKGRTVLIIAHRLSTLKDAQKIMVIDKGNLVEYDTHENLMKREGLYHYLYNQQKRGDIDE